MTNALVMKVMKI